MATEIKSWQIQDGRLVPLMSSLAEGGRKERDDLEQWIKSNPKILGEDIAVIGEQVQTSSGPMDFLGIDTSGNTVIVELKRDKIPREALVQAIDYASDVAEWDNDRFREICQSFSNKTLEDLLQEKFEGLAIEDMIINQAQRLLLVGFAIEFPCAARTRRNETSHAMMLVRHWPGGRPSLGAGEPGTEFDRRPQEHP